MLTPTPTHMKNAELLKEEEDWNDEATVVTDNRSETNSRVSAEGDPMENSRVEAEPNPAEEPRSAPSKNKVKHK